MCDVEQFYHTHPEKHAIMTLCESETQGSTQGQSSMCLLILHQGSQFDALLSVLKSIRQTERECDRTLYYTCVIRS